MSEESVFNERTSHRQLKVGDFTIEGYSRAPVQTFWRIPEFKLGFDLGAQPWEFMGTPRWFISHTHLDHILALPAYVARRRMMKMEPPTIYMPADRVSEMRQLLGLYVRLDRGKLPCEIIGVEPGQTIELSRELVVTVHRVYHTVPSLGFLVWERRKKLKPEYTALTGEQIRDLNQAGVEITYEIRIPRVAYLGDSTCRGLDENPEMYRADVLITEMTFLASGHRHEAQHRAGHFHLDDFIERKNLFENKVVIAAHFSVRYCDAQIEHLVRRQLPDMLEKRLQLWY